MNRFYEILKLVRVRQYYKNLVVFIALFFSGKFFNLDLLILSGLAFMCLCFVSSANYIINDIKDRNRDKLNPEKKYRPIASGKIKLPWAFFYTALLLSIGVSIGSYLGLVFLVIIIAFVVVSTMYTLFFKDEVLLDMLGLSINFVLRTLAGAVAINTWVSPWLIIGTFGLALFLAAGKRKSESVYLGLKAKKHRKVLGKYNVQFLDSLLTIFTGFLVISYALYSFLGGNVLMLASLPIVIYAILRYLHLIFSGSDIARDSSGVLKDKKIVIAIAIYLIYTFIAIQYKIPFAISP